MSQEQHAFFDFCNDAQRRAAKIISLVRSYLDGVQTPRWEHVSTARSVRNKLAEAEEMILDAINQDLPR
jgi:hypothetical protein